MFTEVTLKLMRELKPFPADNDSDVYYHLAKKGIFPWSEISFKRWAAVGRKHITSMISLDIDFDEYSKDLSVHDKWKTEFAMIVDTVKSTNLSPIKAVAYADALVDPKSALEYLKLHKTKDASIINQQNIVLSATEDFEEKSEEELAAMLDAVDKQLESENEL